MSGITQTTTEIHPDKVRAYLAADYRLGHTVQDTILNVGQHSQRLASLFVSHGVASGAFLNAYNPRGTIQSDAANAFVHMQRAAKLQSFGIHIVEGSGSEESTDWSLEKSYFAYGLALDPAKAIGTQFDQDAIVWGRADDIP